MARLRVRLMLNQGRRGAPLAKLGQIAEQTEKFLRALARDCQVESNSSEWLAVDFGDGSVSYDAEFQRDVGPAVADLFACKLERLADHDRDGETLNLAVGPSTALEYSRIGGLIGPDESLTLGIYRADADRPEWRKVARQRSASIKRRMETPLPSHGGVQGILHAWFKEAKEPHFQLRELSTDALVKVFYSPALYADVAKAVAERASVLIVSGEMLFDRATRSASELRATKIELAGRLSSSEFEDFFGSAPDFVVEDMSADG